MNYCENCSCVTYQKRCPLCGTKKLRPVKNDDFCFLIEKDVTYCQMLTGVLKEEGIPYTALPYGEGVESRFGLPLSIYRLFVPFGWLDAARNAVREVESAETENLRKYIIDNKDKLHISPRAEKKYRRKNKLPKETDFCGYCLNIIKTADKIEDNGLLREAACGHFLYCVSERAAVAVNSETFEILSFKLNK